MYLKTNNLSLSYKDGQNTVHAVKNINISFEKQGLYGILGPSGSGKSSLLYLLSGLKIPTTGEVILDGQVLPKNSSQTASIRKNKIGFVFQFHFLINYLTALENVIVGGTKPTPETTAKACQLLTSLGLKDHLHRLPHTLSGGQRQRVAIARAFLNNPEVVFVDEPTSSLDHQNGKQVMELLKGFSLNTTIIVVTHDESILQGAKDTFYMRDGEIVTKSY